MNQAQKNYKQVKIEDLVPGMKLGEDIENKFGGVMLPAQTILDRNKINKLSRLDIQEVKIIEESQKEIAENAEKIEDVELSYRKNLNRVAEIYEKLKLTDKLAKSRLEEVVNTVMKMGKALELIDILTLVQEGDNYNHTHLLNVGILSNMFGRWLGFSQERLQALTAAGLLHDIGKIRIPEEILLKPDELTDEEYKEAKKHVKYSYKIVDEMDELPRESVWGVWSHHERYDGSGYPNELEGEEIPLLGRIIAIVDVFDAVTSDRVYKSGASPFKAIRLFKEEDFKHFDQNLKKIFLDQVPNYFMKREVRLNDGRRAEIVFINPRKPDKPIVKAGDDIIDLYQEEKLAIEEIIK